MTFAKTGLHRYATFLSALVLICLACSAQLEALERPQLAPADPTGEYIILQAGEQRADGFSTPAVLQRNVRPERGTYMPRMLIVKTRARHATPKGARGFLNSTLQASLQNLAVREIITPFPAYNSGDALANDVAGVGRIHEISFEAELDAWEAAQLLMQNPEIEYAEPVYLRYSTFTPDDPRFGQQYHLDRIQAERAWDITRGNPNVVIAIIDSGTDYEHEDLAANIWTNQDEIPNNNRDDDNNGFVDDVIGWDFVGNVSQGQIFSGQFAPDNDPKVRGAGNGQTNHGTIVAGSAAANTHNGTGIAAIGYNSSIMPIKCGSDNGSVRGIFRGYQAILYAAQSGADIINCSWGGYGRSNAEQDVIDQANALGALIVVSSGNEGYHTDLDINFFPANYLGVLNVGASNASDNITGFSNFGAQTRIYAPGAGIWSTSPGNNYSPSSGTSFSAPIVSGIAALVKAQHPSWTAKQIMHQIRSTSDDVFSDGDELEQMTFYGRANAYRAVDMNRSFTSGDIIPGISHEELAVQNQLGLIDSYDETTLRLVIRNYLGTATGLRVEFTSLDGYVDFLNAPINIGTLQNDRPRNVDVNLKLNNRMPWSIGYLDVLVTYRANNYLDYERLRVPVGLVGGTGGNLRFPGQIVSDLTSTVWHSASAPDRTNAWIAGETRLGNQLVGIAARATQTGFQAVNISQGTNFPRNPVYSIAGVNGQLAFVSSNARSGGEAAVWRTSNGGNSWQAVGGSLTSITPFINDIYFFDTQNGVILGDPANNRWGVAVTNDGGNTWTPASQIGAPVPNEAGLVGASTRLGDNVWFGTNTGRVFYSTTQGRTWQNSVVFNGKQITHLAFRSPTEGIAVYRDAGDVNAELEIASTSDGGDNWRRGVASLEDFGVRSVSAAGAPGALDNLIVGDNGEVISSLDIGETFAPILTPTIGPTVTAAVYSDGKVARVWRVHVSGVSYADIDVTPVPEPKLTTVSRSTIVFESTLITETSSEEITISSEGTESVSLDISVQDPVNFSIMGTPPATLASGESYTLTVVFNPQTPGFKNTRLIIDSDGGSHEISMRGIGRDSETTVGETHRGGLSLYAVSPSPAADLASLRFAMAEAGHARLEVIDLRGQTLMVPFDAFSGAGEQALTLNTGLLTPGVYMLRLSTDSEHVVRSFVIKR